MAALVCVQEGQRAMVSEIGGVALGEANLELEQENPFRHLGNESPEVRGPSERELWDGYRERYR